LHTSRPFRPSLRSWRTIVGIPDHDHVALGLLPPLVHPNIEHVMQVEVRQQRRYDGLNAKDNFQFDRAVRYREEGKKR